VFATAADRKVHIYDAANGKQIAELPLGAPTTGAPSMYELGGRQYLLVTASAGPQGTAPGSGGTGPTGIVAYTLPR
jgi:quinoprotein glucose dehydrogenase